MPTIVVITFGILLMFLIIELDIVNTTFTPNLANVVWNNRIIETLIQPFLILAIIITVIILKEDWNE